jgi:uncharacterized iron-regulated membrane protein
MRKKIYGVHRTLSLIVAIPVLLWALSGFMHPLMTNIRPQVATQLLPAAVIDSAHIKTDLAVALQQNHIDSISAFRLVRIDTTWFYQVQTPQEKEPVYLSAVNGKELTAGNWLYAQYLARQFLEGPLSPDSSATPPAATADPGTLHDCCDAATNCVLNGSKGSKVTDASMLTAFDEEYKSINRLLPVYKVGFEREDGIRIYVETTQDRFAFAMDNKRAVFDAVFRLLHTWDWLNIFGKGRPAVVFLVVSLAFVTSVLGVYLFFTTRSKKANGNGMVKTRRWHRYTAIVAALFTLMWTFSGAYHALSRLPDDTRDRYFVSNNFPAAGLHLPLDTLIQIVKAPVTNISIVRMDKDVYWQVYTKGDAGIQYVHVRDYSLLPEGDAKYAVFLAGRFSGNPDVSVRKVTPVTKFTDEYNFTDKRLPVWRIAYDTRLHERYYVETRSGRLSVRVNDMDYAEGYSFALFHKHHFMDWGGKAARDLSTMCWALLQVLMVAVGLVLYFKWKKRKPARR